MTGDQAFVELLQYVEDELSFATSHYNDSYLDRRVSSRMRRTRTDDYREYFRLLQNNTDEQEALLDSMSINVTGFFRNPDVWGGIRDVLRDLTSKNETVYVWSTPCADGREPYSLSMLAHDDSKIDESSVDILATDISEDALDTAKRGVYEESRTVDIGEQLEFLSGYEAYVECENGTYRIDDRIRQNVTFERHDLINDPPKSGFDLVICRNLFIYIDNEYKESMLETIYQSMQDEAYLVIGKAETIPPNLKSSFSITDSRLRIYQRR